MLIILDNGHGTDTPGKRSPKWSDGSQLFECGFNRDIVRRIAEKLERAGIQYKILVPEDWDVSLPERCRRANAISKEVSGDCMLLSIHANAGGGTGWEAWTSPGKTKADAYASIFYAEAEKELGSDGWRIRKDESDGDPDKEAAFYLLKHTVCPAVLTENMFMDTEKDCRFILSESGRDRISKLHVEAIKKIVL